MPTNNPSLSPGQQTPVNLSVFAPEWTVVGQYYQGSDQHTDKIIVYQNGAEVVCATADVPTYDALRELTSKANTYARLIAERDGLVRRVEGLEGALRSLEQTASVVSHKGASTGPQRVGLSVAILGARALLASPAPGIGAEGKGAPPGESAP